jgi:PIN domain nuclease of toxin-antitoxin system
VLIPQQLLVNHIELLGITLQHAAVVAKLPFYHRDPFDRLLIAQAIAEQISVISHDPAFDAYPVQRRW